MSDIVELERRITAALARIGEGIDRLDAADRDLPSRDEMEALRDALEAERSANAELSERVTALRTGQESDAAEHARLVEGLRADISGLEGEVQRLRSVNARLRETSAALRDANAQGLGDAGAIDAAMRAELEALEQLRASDRAELDAIVAELMPLIEGEARHA